MQKVWRFLLVMAAVVTMAVPAMAASEEPMSAFRGCSTLDNAPLKPNSFIGKKRPTILWLQQQQAIGEVGEQRMINDYGDIKLTMVSNLGVQKIVGWRTIVLAWDTVQSEMSGDDPEMIPWFLGNGAADKTFMFCLIRSAGQKIQYVGSVHQMIQSINSTGKMNGISTEFGRLFYEGDSEGIMNMIKKHKNEFRETVKRDLAANNGYTGQ